MRSRCTVVSMRKTSTCGYIKYCACSRPAAASFAYKSETKVSGINTWNHQSECFFLQCDQTWSLRFMIWCMPMKFCSRKDFERITAMFCPLNTIWKEVNLQKISRVNQYFKSKVDVLNLRVLYLPKWPMIKLDIYLDNRFWLSLDASVFTVYNTDIPCRNISTYTSISTSCHVIMVIDLVTYFVIYCRICIFSEYYFFFKVKLRNMYIKRICGIIFCWLNTYSTK